MAKPCDPKWDEQRQQIVGLGDRSFHKSYYPQLRQNLDRLERFHTLLDHTADFVILVSLPDGHITDANEALSRLVGVPLVALINRTFVDLNLDSSKEILQILTNDIAEYRPEVKETPPMHSVMIKYVPEFGGTPVWLEISYCLAVLDQHFYGVMVGRDVSERKRYQEMLSELISEKDALLDNALVGIAMVKNRRFVSCNRRFNEIFGYRPGEAIGKSTRVLYESDEVFLAFGQEAYHELANHQQFCRVQRLVRSDGTPFWCEMTGNAIDSENSDNGSVWMLADVTERKDAEERASYLSYHDALSGLPNHRLLQDRFQQAIVNRNYSTQRLAVLVVDLDRFKTINDALGYNNANQVLIAVGKRLKNLIRPNETVSRQGGDEFTLLLTDFNDIDELSRRLMVLMGKFSDPIIYEGQEITLSVSIGVSLYPDDASDFDSLRQKADLAMYRAKEAGRHCYRFFSEEMNTDARSVIALHNGLRRALEHDQFQLFYQPQLDISSQRVIGVEALIRWRHPEQGLVPPIRFIPVAEETGLIVEMGEWVLQEACRMAARCVERGYPDFIVAVNLSAIQFKRGDIEASIIQAIEQANISPQMLEIEITESTLIQDVEKVIQILNRLKNIGIRISIDDFGTGYSSFAYLKKLHLDKLKIDQSFVKDMVSDQENKAIVQAIIQMAHSLGLNTIAEGVETKEILDLLGELSCHEAQGYYMSRPIPEPELFDYLAINSHLQKKN